MAAHVHRVRGSDNGKRCIFTYINMLINNYNRLESPSTGSIEDLCTIYPQTTPTASPCTLCVCCASEGPRLSEVLTKQLQGSAKSMPMCAAETHIPVQAHTCRMGVKMAGPKIGGA